MKRKKIILTLRITLTIVFLAIFGFIIYRGGLKFGSDSLAFAMLGLVNFIGHTFAWIMPRKFYNFCWKLCKYNEDQIDYDTGFADLDITTTILLGIGVFFLIISCLLIFFGK